MPLYTFEYRFEGKAWRVCPRAFKTINGAKRCAAADEAAYLNCGHKVETRLIELVSDGRNGKVAANG